MNTIQSSCRAGRSVLSSSKRAVHLYEKAGFEQTERYNDNYTADIFMVLNLDK